MISKIRKGRLSASLREIPVNTVARLYNSRVKTAKFTGIKSVAIPCPVCTNGRKKIAANCGYSKKHDNELPAMTCWNAPRGKTYSMCGYWDIAEEIVAAFRKDEAKFPIPSGPQGAAPGRQIYDVFG